MEFGRERDGVDLSQVVLTHHILRDRGNRALPLGEGESPTLKPLTDAGSGSVQEKEKARLGEIIAKVNDLFGADTKISPTNGQGTKIKPLSREAFLLSKKLHSLYSTRASKTPVSTVLACFIWIKMR